MGYFFCNSNSISNERIDLKIFKKMKTELKEEKRKWKDCWETWHYQLIKRLLENCRGSLLSSSKLNLSRILLFIPCFEHPKVVMFQFYDLTLVSYYYKILDIVMKNYLKKLLLRCWLKVWKREFICKIFLIYICITIFVD